MQEVEYRKEELGKNVQRKHLTQARVLPERR
jgi:hypothetical protein